MAEGSRVVRGLRAGWPALAWAATIFFLSHQQRLPLGLPVFPHADKVAHAGAYALLGGMLVRALVAAGTAARRALWLGLVIASLYGASDEWHQSFVPGRDPDPCDWAADTAGALLGAVWVASLPRRKSRASIRG